MIVETTGEDYASLLLGHAPRHFKLADSPIAPPDILQMLAGIAEQVRREFSSASWLIVEDDEVVGLCSITRPPKSGVIDIGYGIAPSRQRRGIAGRAIADVVAWAKADPRVRAVTAETSPDNVASQRILVRCGFVRMGERYDEEDGPLICWQVETG